MPTRNPPSPSAAAGAADATDVAEVNSGPAARTPSPAIRRLARALRLALLAAVCAFLGVQAARAMREIARGDAVAQLQPAILVVATLTTTVALLVSALNWHYLLRVSGANVDWRKSLQIFAWSHLARYVPGRVWAVLGKIVLSVRSGVSPVLSAQCTALEAMIAVLTATALAITVLPLLGPALSYQWTTALLAALVVAVGLHPRVFASAANLGLRWFRRPPITVSYSFRAILGAFVIQMLAWQIFGVAFYLLVRAIAPASAFPWSAAAGSFATAWVVGYLSALTPAGLGVREAVLLLVLSAWLPAESATVVALASRAMATAAELLGFLLLLLARALRLL